MKVTDIFSDVGCHAIGLLRAGPFKIEALVERDAHRQSVLKSRFPDVPVYGDVKEFKPAPTDVLFGGPPCQETSVAAAVHSKRSGQSLWGEMLRVGLDSRTKWFVVEQPPGNKAWEAEVFDDLSRIGFHSARLEFGACDVGAPYIRRRVFILACASLSRLEIAWQAGPSAIDQVKRAADARGTWSPDKLKSIRVVDRAPHKLDPDRQARIEALGDANPPEMAEVIGHCLLAAA